MARPLAFDRQQKLKQAMLLFWRKGYASTSMQDLVDELGINRFSIYNTFGDKQALFRQATELYKEKIFSRLLQALAPIDVGLPCIDNYLDAFHQALNQQKKVTGCLMQNTLLEGGVDDAMALGGMRDDFFQLRDRFCAVLEQAKRLKQIDKRADCAALADFLLLQVQGIIALQSLKSEQTVERALQVLKTHIQQW